mmetsp:Transcript_3458/g.9160  ORF Transcript_3458/g.9160 Transcript_3458/m.9160 type:complete len:306 (-) Transcript_3458:498-1415(-)
MAPPDDLRPRPAGEAAGGIEAPHRGGKPGAGRRRARPGRLSWRDPGGSRGLRRDAASLPARRRELDGPPGAFGGGRGDPCGRDGHGKDRPDDHDDLGQPAEAPALETRGQAPSERSRSRRPDAGGSAVGNRARELPPRSRDGGRSEAGASAAAEDEGEGRVVGSHRRAGRDPRHLPSDRVVPVEGGDPEVHRGRRAFRLHLPRERPAREVPAGDPDEARRRPDDVPGPRGRLPEDGLPEQGEVPELRPLLQDGQARGPPQVLLRGNRAADRRSIPAAEIVGSPPAAAAAPRRKPGRRRGGRPGRW